MEKFELHQNFYKEPSWNGKQINPLEGIYQKEYTEWVEEALIPLVDSNMDPIIEKIDIEIRHPDIILEALKNYREEIEDKLAEGKEIRKYEEKLEEIDKAIEYVKLMEL